MLQLVLGLPLLRLVEFNVARDAAMNEVRTREATVQEVTALVEAAQGEVRALQLAVAQDTAS